MLNSTISADDAAQFTRAVLTKQGLTSTHVDFIVDTLMFASMRGVDTHGIELLPTYIKELEGGRANRQPEIRDLRSSPALVHLDGNGGLGVVVANVGLRRAIEIARQNGVGAVAVANSNHFGPAGYYSYLAAQSGMIGLAFSNSDVLVAAHNGAKAASGTNPIAIAAQAQNDEVFCLDMATSQVAYSRVRRNLAEDLPIGEGWAVDADGRDSSESGEISALSPLGGYKGQGLAMAVQILTAVLTQMPLDHELTHLFSEPYDKPRKVAHFFLCIDIQAACDPLGFQAQLSELTSHMRRQSRVGYPAVLSPGDAEAEVAITRRKNGIPVSQTLLECFGKCS